MSSGAVRLWPTREDRAPGYGSEFARARREAVTRVDPIARILDPNFTEALWHYEHSRLTSPMLPGQLHAKQLEALHDEHPHRWLFWGNQVGKTTVGCIDVDALCLGRHPVQKWQPPIVAWASALTWEMWENVLLPELLTWLPPWRILSAPEPYRRSTNRVIRIRADNGAVSSIFGKAAEQGAKKYQSARVHRVLMDEEHPEAIYDEIQPRLLRFGGDTIATMTPLLGLTWVHDRVYAPYQEGKPEILKNHYVSHAGLADNPSIKREEIERITVELQHNPAQLAARLYGHFMRPAGAVLPWDPKKHLVELTEKEVRELIRLGAVFGGMDFGLWRWAFVFGAADREGNLVLIEEIFSQNESLEVRATKLDTLLKKWDVQEISIFGDCANPTDILEVNLALERIGSRYRIGAVIAENKAIAPGISRLVNLMNRGAFKVRKALGIASSWMLGMNASRPGKPVLGSRWVWEIANWLYVKAKPKVAGETAQADDPDDNTADGADMMAATRYLVMSWYQAATPPEKKRALTVVERLKKELQDLDRGVKNEEERVTRYRGTVLRQ